MKVRHACQLIVCCACIGNASGNPGSMTQEAASAGELRSSGDTIELLRNRDLAEINDGQPVDWRYYTYGDQAKIYLANEKHDGQKAICIESDNLRGKGYIFQEMKDLRFRDNSTVKISGYYKTDDIGIDKDGRCFVENKFNNREPDSKLKRFQVIELKPSKEWTYFESTKKLDVPLRNALYLAMLYNCSGRLYLAGLSSTISAGQMNDAQYIYIWREAEGLCPGFSCSAYKPQEFKEDKNYFSGEGAVFNSKKEPFIWNFKEKGEVDPETLFPKKNSYKIWLRLYGYRQTPQMNVNVDGKLTSSFKTRNTERIDEKGEYLGGGEFYWQAAGEFTGEGGNHQLKITPEGAFGIDAIVFTTDTSFQPKLFEAKEKANKDHFTDIKSGPVMKSEYKTCGVSDKIVSPLTFRPHMPENSPIKIKNDDPPAIFHLTLPACVNVKNVSSHWAGTTWNIKDRWGERYLTYKKTGEKLINNERYDCYEIYLYYLWIDIFVFIQGDPQNFLYNKNLKGFYCLEYKGAKEPEEELHLRTVEMKPTKAFSEIFIGPAGKGFKSFFNEYPNICEGMVFSGINFANPWNINSQNDKGIWNEFVDKCVKSKIIVAGEISPLHGAYGPDEAEKAIDLDGSKTTIPSLGMDLKGKAFQKNLNALEELMSEAVTGIAFDDENYNQCQDKIDYSKRCKELFEQYLSKRNQPYKDPVDIVKNKKQEKELYDLWVDFKCDMVLERYKAYREKYDECYAKNVRSTTFSKKYFIPQILKNTTPQESKVNTYWDYKKLAAYSTHISPMIYTYQGIRDSHMVGDTIKMYDEYIGKNIIAPTLLAGHGDFGEIPLAEKKMIKYQVYESLMNKSPGILYWVSDAFYDPLNLAQVSEAIRLTQPYEEFFLKGEPYATIKATPDWVRLIALKHKNDILLYVANYRNEAEKKITVVLDKTATKILDLQKNVQVPVNNARFEVDFIDERGKLFLIKEAL